MVLGRGEVAGVDSLGVERIGKHGFPCGLWHPLPRRLEAAVLCRPLAGPVDQALEGGLYSGPLSQLQELRVGPALPLISLGVAVALGGGEGPGTDGVGGPGGLLVVPCSVGVRGEWGHGQMWTRGYARTVSASGLGWDSRWRR